MTLGPVVAWLDDYLRIRDVPDDSLAFNGLEVENDGRVTRVAVAVDACQTVFDRAAEQQADLLIVHHGLFWGGLEPLTGRHGRRVAMLMRHNIAVYSAHIPLDVHPDVGNNAVLARALEIPIGGSWGEYKGASVGLWGDAELSRELLGERLGAALGVVPKLLPFGPAVSRRVGIVTGAGGSMIAEAKAAGIDTFVTGEGKHHSFFDAEELGINVYYAGHYATETVGVKALGERLGAQFTLPWSFIDHPTGL
jgi:dinuclear metal center YbgI/SA1388 family protein